ncbi:MAG: hypothetical protein WC091_06340 [Sulfuricellaceae bacterium]
MGKASRRKKEVRKNGTLEIPDYLKNLPDATFVQVPGCLPDDEKISVKLAHLLVLVVPENSSSEKLNAVLGLIVTAWNISLQDETQRQRIIDNAIKESEYEDNIKGVLYYFIAKKLELFPLDKRYVVSAKALLKGHKLSINASAISPKEIGT